MLPLDPAAVELTRRPLAQATQLPGPAFLDPAVLAWEQEHLFTREWVCAGHVDQIRAQGQFFTVAGRRRERRRGRRRRRAAARVRQHLPAPRRARRQRARGPDEAAALPVPRVDLRPRRVAEVSRSFTDELEGFDKCDYGLHPVRLAVVEGLVLLDLSGEAPPPEQPRRRPSGARRALPDRRPAPPAPATRTTVDANWKVIAENYNECLHCPGVHPELNALCHYLSRRADRRAPARGAAAR